MATGRDSQRGGDITEVAVVGAGPAGLACAAALAERGIRTVVLEKGDGVAATWRGRYRALRLNSGRPFSTLPGSRFPPGTPMFPSRDELIRYLEGYCSRHSLDVRTGVAVERLDPDGDRWRIGTGRGPLTAPQLVVATGLLSRPFLPEALTGEGVGVPVVHSADYVDAMPYHGRDVLVVGAGSSGMEIAHDLVAGGARRGLLSVRTPPNILPRSVGGLSGDPAVLLLMRLPPRLADAALRPMRRLTIGDLRSHGLPIPSEGPFTRLRHDPTTGPAVVDREVIDDIRTGRIRVVAAMRNLAGGSVLLTDGTMVQVDAVVAATGFRPGLEPLVGHLGILDLSGIPTAFDDHACLPGLRFLNFRHRPGMLGAAGGRARRTATAIAHELGSRKNGTEIGPGRRKRRSLKIGQRDPTTIASMPSGRAGIEAGKEDPMRTMVSTQGGFACP